MNKMYFMPVLLIFICAGGAVGPVKDNFTQPGPYSLKSPDPGAVQTVGNITGMLEGALTGIAVGAITGLLTYNAAYTGHSIGLAAWMSVGMLVFAVPGAIIGWNIPYGVIGLPDENDRKTEIEKRTDEKIRDLFKDKTGPK